MKFCILFTGIYLVLFLFSVEVQGQNQLEKRAIVLKLDEFIEEYQQLSNFSIDFLNAKTRYISDFTALFKNPEEKIICNDLPLLAKNNRFLTPNEYCSLLYAEFDQGLVAEIRHDSINIQDIGYQKWKAEVFISKTFFGGFRISSNKKISHDLKIDLLFDEGFKIIQISNRGDRDLDGVKDEDDICMNEYGFPKFDGCPDADLDDVSDHIDRCPDTPDDQMVNRFGCERFYYGDAGFMEIDVNPTLVIHALLDSPGKKKESLKIPVGDALGVKYSLTLVKALAGNYLGRVHALKSSAGLFHNSFFQEYPVGENYSYNPAFFSMGYRKYSTANNLYQGVGVYLLLNLANKGFYNNESLGYYAEFGYQLKMAPHTRLNIGIELMHFNDLKVEGALSQTMLGLKTAFMFNLDQ